MRANSDVQSIKSIDSSFLPSFQRACYSLKKGFARPFSAVLNLHSLYIFISPDVSSSQAFLISILFLSYRFPSFLSSRLFLNGFFSALTLVVRRLFLYGFFSFIYARHSFLLARLFLKLFLSALFASIRPRLSYRFPSIVFQAFLCFLFHMILFASLLSYRLKFFQQLF